MGKESIMRLTEWMNSRIKRFRWTDIACIELASIAFGLLLASLLPSLLSVSPWWYLLVWLGLALKPLSKVID